MNKLILLIIITLVSNVTFSQSGQAFFTKSDRINKFHTIDDLEDLGKGDLVSLYADRFAEITKIMPFMAITTKSDQKLQDVGIRENSENIKLLSKYKEDERERIRANNNLIADFVAYADSENIIWSILYMEDIIKKLRLGFKGNF
ncbi:hypothetical protein KO493_12915 [Tamlana agarivorans]|uniref:Uncharacterized protein n=1 Tax=Pseudotamlana agarivorans TaxID=481183 RepID=A0ACC5UBH2_9FLAO|nr:hypothetical protein [Tamlana agarivorans]MBU2951601.1 hypothetical protein [Tamlana agarivorans]